MPMPAIKPRHARVNQLNRMKEVQRLWNAIQGEKGKELVGTFTRQRDMIALMSYDDTLQVARVLHRLEEGDDADDFPLEWIKNSRSFPSMWIWFRKMVNEAKLKLASDIKQELVKLESESPTGMQSFVLPRSEGIASVVKEEMETDVSLQAKQNTGAVNHPGTSPSKTTQTASPSFDTSKDPDGFDLLETMICEEFKEFKALSRKDRKIVMRQWYDWWMEKQNTNERGGTGEATY